VAVLLLHQVPEGSSKLIAALSDLQGDGGHFATVFAYFKLPAGSFTEATAFRGTFR
jgi:hypothetical protein